ncbi:putative oligomeric Golgi complex subunit 5 protein [Helianthus annuus]|nr:putative oligomeric Golgi complex subunit 5 protein [Helianthus annuus]KAJ0643631.1 putative oligomeric Golgi complex subunit 5 protein [Helianthus annuus]KAJ0819744.1 putative oligomeric Golgi complex subunit 5 protein [Helianthus annuus]
MASPAVHRTSIQRVSTFKDRTTTTTATPSTSSSLSLLDSFASDPIFSKFLSSDFNSTQFSSDALSSGTAAARAEKIQDGIRLLEKQLRSEVLNRHDDLLAQLSSVKDADSSLASIRSAVSTLQSSVRRIRSEIADPNRQIRSKTVQLSNLHFTVDLLQSTVRVLRLSKKLREVMAEPDVQKLDLSKAAQLHSEILRLCNENDLSGIGVIDEELKLVFEAGQRLRSEGMKALERGLEGFNQAEVGAGLQVFYNLGELRSTVDGLINKYKSQGVKSVSVALDMKAISGGGGGFGGPGGIQRSGTPQIGSGGKAKEALWQRMGSCMDQLHSVVVAIWHLQRVLSKKRDPFTHVLLLDEVMQDGDPLLTARVWEAIVKSFANQMKSTFTASSFVKEIFTVGYPKLLSMIENLVERISRDTDVKGVLPAITVEGRDQMVGAIEVFQTAFLALCLSRLSDLVNSVFPMSNRGSVPSKEHISRIISRIQEEIEAVQLDARLTLLVLREISKVLLLLAQRAEYQISTGPEARQISGPATPAQVKNFTLCQHLQDIHGSISAMTKGLPPIASDILSQSLNTIYEVACDSVTSLFQSMLDRLESCILEIHNQNFGATDNNSSSYMEELQKHISHFRTEFLSKLLPSSAKVISIGTENICTRLVRSMASRVLIFFIRHASLVRPLSESGKLRMARDMAELELAVGQNLFPVEQLGAPYRALRAFRPVIFLETSQLNGSPLLQDLPPSVILHHLYSRAPDELQSPMQRNKLSPLQYSLWLDSQGEDQIWKGIKATLDDYAVQVKARGDKEFSPVYPLMSSLGSSLTENNVVSRKSNTIQ